MLKPGSHIVRHGDRSYSVEVDAAGQLHIAGIDGAFSATPEPDGTYRVRRLEGAPAPPEPDGEGVAKEPGGTGARDQAVQCRALVAGTGDRRQVFVNGEVYELHVEPAGRARRAAAKAAVELLTVPMPARVVKVLVAVGQEVRRGDVVVKLEAMKMELPLRAPKDGVVRAIGCREGDLVQPGVNLLELA